MTLLSSLTNRIFLASAMLAGVLFPIQAVVGGLQILTGLSGWSQTIHVALGALIWAALAALVFVSYYSARVAAAPVPSAGEPGSARAARSRRNGPTPSAPTLP